jgi:hypothetical protein
MAEFAKYLPLSNRASADESGVTSDRRAAIAGTVDEAVRLLIAATDDETIRLVRARRFLEEAGLGTGASGGSAEEMVRLADAIRSGRRRSTRLLVRTTRALLVLGDGLGATPSLDPMVSGSVALMAAGTAPFERRAVLRGHTVRASDEGWSFGHGPVLEGPGRGILRFVLALDDVPPQPVSSPR